jgi:hypothetical protein
MLHREQNWRSAMSIRDVLSNAAPFAEHASRTRAPSAVSRTRFVSELCQIPPDTPAVDINAVDIRRAVSR